MFSLYPMRRQMLSKILTKCLGISKVYNLNVLVQVLNVIIYQ